MNPSPVVIPESCAKGQHSGAEILPVSGADHQLPPQTIRYCGACGAIQRKGKWKLPAVLEAAAPEGHGAEIVTLLRQVISHGPPSNELLDEAAAVMSSPPTTDAALAEVLRGLVKRLQAAPAGATPPRRE